MTRYRDSMNTVSMELIRFMENKIIREEKNKKKYYKERGKYCNQGFETTCENTRTNTPSSS